MAVYDVILLIGQSNMVGRYGPIDGALDATDSRIKQYGSTAQVIALASDPLDHLDETANTVGLGLSMAKDYADNVMNPAHEVLLVPAAQGATSFSSGFWRSGGVGYNNAIARANEAIALGDPGTQIVAMMWHQGESDNALSEVQYAADIDSLITDLRSMITGASAVPFIVGGISTDSVLFSAGVQAALVDTPNRNTLAAFVDVDGLALGLDELHFSAVSQRLLGSLYTTGIANAINPPANPDPFRLNFDGGSRLPITNYTILTNDSIKLKVTPTNSTNQGFMVSGYVGGDAGRWYIGYQNGRFDARLGGDASGVLVVATNGTTYDVELRKTGTLWEYLIDGNVEWSVTTSFTPLPLDTIGGTNTGTFLAEMELEFLTTTTRNYSSSGSNRTLFPIVMSDIGVGSFDATGIGFDSIADWLGSESLASVLNMTITGAGNDTLSFAFYDAANDAFIKRESVVFSSDVGSVNFALAVGSEIGGLYYGANPPTTGTGSYGVTE